MMTDTILQFQPLFDMFEKCGHELYFVGGFVRDTYMNSINPNVNVNTNDIDFATSALPEETMNLLKRMKLHPIPIGIEFGTIQVLFDEFKVEITTFRTQESYKKGSRKPSVVFGKNLEGDLLRRDFTINAFAMDRSGEIIDPLKGAADLTFGSIRCPIDPKESFSDDPLRMLRAFRFAERFQMRIEQAEMEAIMELGELIKSISSERVFEEMSKILMSDKPDYALDLMAKSGLFKHAFPELQEVVDFKQNQGKWHSKLVWPHTMQVVAQTPKILEVRWAALIHDIAKPQTYSESESGVHFFQHEVIGAKIWLKIADRLKVSSKFKEEVYFLVLEHLSPGLLSNSDVADKGLRRFVNRCETFEKIEKLFFLSKADITSSNKKLVSERISKLEILKKRIEEIINEQKEVKLVLPKGLGNSLMKELNIPPGKQLGKIMNILLSDLIDGKLTIESNFIEAARKIITDEQ